MKTIHSVVLTICALFCVIPVSVRAEVKAGSYELSPFGGYNFFEDSQNIEDSPIVGGRIGYNFTKHIGLEGAAEFIKSSVDDEEIGFRHKGQVASPMDTVRLRLYHIDAVYHFMPESRFNPFVLAGLGQVHYNPKISDKNMTGFNIGIGAKYWIAEHVALRVDVRDYMVNEVFDHNYHNIGTTIGLTFAFGGTKSTPAGLAATSPAQKVVVVESEPEEEDKVAAAAAAAEPKVVILAFEDVHFDYNDATLKEDAKVKLKRNIEILDNNPEAKVRIAGYTSAYGTQANNQDLSERRAKAVQDYLIDEGIITRDRLSIIGYGENRPAVYEAAPDEIYSEAAMSNMRVLFEIEVK